MVAISNSGQLRYAIQMHNEVSIFHSTALGGFDILNSQVQDFEYAAHRHSEVVIAAYAAGAKIATCGKHKFGVNSGDILVIGPETLHKATTVDNRGWQYQSVYLMPDQISISTGLTVSEVERRVAGHRLHRQADAMGIKLRQALEDVEHQPLALAEFLTELLSKTNFGEIEAVSVSASIRIVYDHLAHNLAAKITLVELAELASLSPEYLSRQFKTAYGLSPFQFLTFARVRMAKNRIISGSSLSEAAYAVGFADQSHLNRWFKRIYGVSPGAFAKSQMRSRLTQ